MSFDHYDTNLRVYKDINIRRLDPYGFWVIEGIPELNESYTQPILAKKVIDSYLEKNPVRKLPSPEIKPKRGK